MVKKLAVGRGTPLAAGAYHVTTGTMVYPALSRSLEDRHQSLGLHLETKSLVTLKTFASTINLLHFYYS